MAKNNIFFVGALLFVLLFAYGVSFSEERVLKADHYEAFVADNVGTEYDTDDFRPTTPGHSPGAGHSTGPNSDDYNVGTEYDTDDFRPTTPGHSPGAGHSTGPNSDDCN
ncbi:hypothetical protein GOBAR_AA08572 [Gossypium barbadense]|uniref:Uncharacterized protein n=1 Tax=Gossypium barbadense TaxID=3634 RepID=A0A2P5Y933_GOSBA|nr:hypothetical protein GOBAR_AA08572 [Gossypium barbadense]